MTDLHHSRVPAWLPGLTHSCCARRRASCSCSTVCRGALIVVRLFARPVAFLLAGEMAVAYFMMHAPRNLFPLLNSGEVVQFCFVYLFLMANGAGPISLDAIRRNATRASRPNVLKKAA